MLRLALIAAVALVAAPAAAQTWGRYDGAYDYDGARGYGDRYGYGGYDRRYSDRDWNAVPSTFDWRSQLDRPGDYRCDQFWDANRTDCGAAWRDQRHRVSAQARSDYRALAGYGYGYRDGYGGRGDYGRRRGYGSSYGYGHGHGGYGYGSGGTTYEGAYGRPDVVFPGGGRRYGGSYGYAGGGRDPHRIDWCRATYRSYDPASGYYRAWSGRLVWCG